MALKILLIDDHEVVVLGLKALLEQRPGFEVVGWAMSAAEGLEKARRLRPDVAVIDVRMRDASGIDVCRSIMAERPETKVIMLTSFPDEDPIFAAIDAGAKGYVLKEISGEALLRAIEAVSRGESFLDPAITGKVLARLKNWQGRPKPKGEEALSGREREILRLIVEGKTNREIASELHLSEKTVRNYVSAILDKLNLNNRTEAAAFVLRKNLSL